MEFAHKKDVGNLFENRVLGIESHHFGGDGNDFHVGHAIQAAAEQDYEAFLRQELAYRRKLGYPPYARLARLELRDSVEERAAREAARMGELVGRWIAASDRRTVEMIGPTPCFFSRRDGYYRWQIILRGQDPAALLRGLRAKL
jgi:primosomal protein N' (replication factor Y)